MLLRCGSVLANNGAGVVVTTSSSSFTAGAAYLRLFSSAVSSAATPSKNDDVSAKIPSLSLEFPKLKELYLGGKSTPSEVVSEIERRIGAAGQDNVWTFRIPSAHIKAKAKALDKILSSNSGSSLEELYKKYPLFGVPFAVKDNIEVAGYPTTAACPAFSYTPWRTAPVIEKLEKAGAILIGKNNMDQFATGLVGVRSPYGVARNPFNPEYCPGGSSSGSGVSVGAGLVSFSIGTDTAGSGRIPAAFNNIVGLKPTRGLLSTTGLIPACRSLDCLSVFALTVDDAWRVCQLAKGYDPDDEYSRIEVTDHDEYSALSTIRIGIPDSKGLRFFGDTNGAKELYTDSLQKLISTLRQNGKTIELVELDFGPFTEVARVLYEGPFVAERLSALDHFIRERSDAVFPITRDIIARGDRFTAVDTFKAMRRLEKLRRETYEIWNDAKIDLLVVPTASITPTVKEAQEVPLGINTVLGYYTNFVNLLDMCGLAVPGGFLPSGMPGGITLIATAFKDRLLAQIGTRYQEASNLPLGATKFEMTPRSPVVQAELFPPVQKSKAYSGKKSQIAVVGAHLEGLPLNYQLTDLNGKLFKKTKTRDCYQMFYIPPVGSLPARPGLVQTKSGGQQIEVEIWDLPTEEIGSFMDNVKPPLTIGNIILEDGSTVKGFLCESYAIEDAKEITSFGGWRNFINSQKVQAKN